MALECLLNRRVKQKRNARTRVLVLLRKDERYVSEYTQQLVPMHFVVYHHHKPMLDIQHTQIRHYSRRDRERERKREKCGKKKNERMEEKKRKEKEAGSMEGEREYGGLQQERIWAS